MAHDTVQRKKGSGQLKEFFRALGPAFGPSLLFLTPKGYWARTREGRSPFSPTLYQRRKSLPKASIEGRTLSQEPYLRPTPYCNSHAPEILALADNFRQRTNSDWDYTKSIFDYVRNEIHFAIEPPPRHGALGTIENGCGLCLDKTNALVAIARAGGIPARYCKIGNLSSAESNTIPNPVQVFIHHFETWDESSDWRLRNIGRGIAQRLKNQAETGFRNAPLFGLHILAELKIGNSWILTDPTWGDAEAVASGMPLPRLGYDPTILGFKFSIVDRSEDIPVGGKYWIGRWLLCMLSRGALDHLNHSFDERRQEGNRILSEIGEAEYINRMRRFYIPLPAALDFGLSLR